ncbi:hypothetical protein [Pontibacter qinzhouensis]|nr:hypothetical protein [Pontibacter qinzhouensis]
MNIGEGITGHRGWLALALVYGKLLLLLDIKIAPAGASAIPVEIY